MRLKNILILTIFFLLTSCMPISCTPPIINVNCNEASLIDAITKANLGPGHNTLILDEDCTYDLAAVDNYITDEEYFGNVGGTGLPPISTPITIEGNNATIQRHVGAPNFRILFVTSTGDLTLNDLSIHNGAALEGNKRGGGIYVNGSVLTLENVQVDNNTADLFGGGIYNDEGSLTITNSSVNYNQAVSGGGIENNSGTIIVDGDSTITNNTATIHGGGMSSFGGDLTINGGQVTNNQAGSSGGAIIVDGYSPLTFLTLDGVLFEGNTSNDEGGAISMSDITFSIMDSTFINNQTSGAIGPGGGAVIIKDSAQGTIGDGSLFDGNYSQGFGGAISINKYSGGIVSIYDTTVHNNSSEGRGGGIYSHGSLFINNSTISANTTLTDEGGGVYSQNGELIIQDSTFSNNSSASQGGGVRAYQSTITMMGSIFQGNQTSTSGGGLSTQYSTVDISDGSIFDGNTAQAQGGGIYNGQDCVMTLQDSTVSNNQASVSGTNLGGGGISNHQGTMTITTTAISGNTSGYDGGGVVNNGFMLITQSTINNNTAANQGGGIWGGNLSIINCTVSGNHADSSGGGVAALSNTSISNSTIVHNTTDYWSGGGISSHPNNTIKNSIVALNTAAQLYHSDCGVSPPLNAVGENLSSDYDTTCEYYGFTIQADPLIGPLADNGGPTWTHALLPGSPALDAAADCTDSTGTPLTFDQRFASRPGGQACDIGAYEDSDTFVPPPAILPTVPPPQAPEPTDETANCDPFAGLEISVHQLNINPETMVLPIYLRFPGAVPEIGEDGIIPFRGELGGGESNLCNQQGFEDRLYCMFTLQPSAPGTLQDLEIYMADCPDPVLTIPKVTIPELTRTDQPGTSCTADLTSGDCEAAGGHMSSGGVQTAPKCICP